MRQARRGTHPPSHTRPIGQKCRELHTDIYAIEVKAYIGQEVHLPLTSPHSLEGSVDLRQCPYMYTQCPRFSIVDSIISPNVVPSHGGHPQAPFHEYVERLHAYPTNFLFLKFILNLGSLLPSAIEAGLPTRQEQLLPTAWEVSMPGLALFCNIRQKAFCGFCARQSAV
jgi:hypothetical protein